MTTAIAHDPIYRHRRFQSEIIELCVRWYLTYRLSYRDLVEMLAERGIAISHSTILRWVQRYVPEFERRWGRFARRVHSSWRMDETAVSVRGCRLFESGRGREGTRQRLLVRIGPTDRILRRDGARSSTRSRARRAEERVKF